MKNISWRLIVIAAVILAAVIYVIPTFQPGVWPHKKINLGLDLQGGMHLALEVDADKAVENTIERIGQEMRTLMRKERIRHQGIERVDAVGGGARSDVLLQLMADTWGVPVRRRSIVDEANSLGAAIIAAKTVGLVDDWAAARELSEVEAVQQQIVDIVRRLEDAGEIVISRGGEDEVIV